MSENRQSPRWLNKLLELGNAKPSRSDVKKRAYRTSSYRFFWGILGIFIYFLFGAYLLNGGSGSSGNSGIFKLLFGAVIVGGLAAFLGPRFNESLEKLFPSGRRKQEESRKKAYHRGAGSSRRHSSDSVAQRHLDGKAKTPHPDQSEGSKPPPVKTDT